MNKTLEEFSKIPSSDFCLAHLFTYRDFVEDVLGIAYRGSNDIIGGICAKTKNTGLTSLLSHGVIHIDYFELRYSSNPTNYNTSVDSKTLQLLSSCNLKNIENSEKVNEI